MEEIRIIHTGDTHLGYRQYHSDVRRQDFLNAFSTVIDNAIDMDVDAVVHAGDLFDSRNPTLDDILDAMELFSRLKKANIPLLAIVGNHESKQNTQWLDLYSSLGLVTRLSAEAYRLGDVALYGIDSVAKTKIPLFDYSIFEGHETDARYNLLVMHQLVKPFSFGEWDIQEILESIPFDIHAVLLGDNHKYEITKVDGTWVTYAGSTERNSTSEREPRSYNIISVGENGIEISKRVIPTREFVFIPANVTEGSNAHDDVFSAIMEHDIKDKVVFVELSGDVQAGLDFSEIENFLLSRGALVPGIKDLRSGVDTLEDSTLKVTFSDPDDVVKEEIRKMNLTSGGLLLDEIIRDPQVVKTKVGDEAELKLGELLDKLDFTEPIPVTESVHPDENITYEVPEVSKEVSEKSAYIDDAGALLSSKEPSGTEEVKSKIQPVDSKKKGTREKTEERQVSAKTENEPEENEKTGSGSEGRNKGKRTSQKEKKEPESVKPRQYNLGDYL